MKNTPLIIVFLLSVLSCFSQDQSNQLPERYIVFNDSIMEIQTEFSNGLIIFTLPSPYNSTLYRPVAVPRFVTTRRTMKVCVNKLSKDEMLAQLIARLSKSPDKKDKAQSVNYLKDLALFIYLSNNNTVRLPQLSRNLIAEWEKANISFKEELKLAMKYLSLADSFQQQQLR